MRLSILKARFAKFSLGAATDIWPNGRPGWKPVESLAEADGVFFLCPKCFTANHGEVGTHMVGCWFCGKVPDWVSPKPGRWNPGGTGLEDLTFVGPGKVSVHLTAGCGWHGFIRQGGAVDA